MSTAQLGISMLIRDLLMGHPSMAEGRVMHQRRRPMPQAVGQQIFVYLEDSTGRHISNSTEWETRVCVDCVARDSATRSLAAEDAADSLAYEVHRRVMEDATLGGAALEVACHLQWTEEEAETAVAATKVLCIVRHRTSRKTLS